MLSVSILRMPKLTELNCVFQVVTMAMDRKDPEREAASVLLASLFPKMVSQARHATAVLILQMLFEFFTHTGLSDDSWMEGTLGSRSHKSR